MGGVIGGVLLLVGALTLGVWIGRTRHDSAGPPPITPARQMVLMESGRLAPDDVSGRLEERSVTVGGRLHPEATAIAARLRYD